MALLSGNLLPASFRGVPFGVERDDLSGGRRAAIHQYYGRDTPWAEDLGRDARRFHFRGFLVQDDTVYRGGPIQAQRAAMLVALEAKGAGILTHPSFGVLKVQMLRFSIGQELTAARASQLDLEFVETGTQVFPSIPAVSSLLSSAGAAAAVGFAADAARVIAALSSDRRARASIAGTAATLSAAVVAAGDDATAMHRLAARLPGNFGRFAGGGNLGASGATVAAWPAGTTVRTLVETASADRTAISAAADALAAAIAAADLADDATISAGTDALLDALRRACADPRDVFRLMLVLIQLAGSIAAAEAPDRVIVQLFQRSAARQIALACAGYQPLSADDAEGWIARLANCLSALEFDAAGTDDESFAALQALRAAIVADLRGKAGTRAELIYLALPAPVPSLALAQRLYQDAARAAELEFQSACIHPLFLPTKFPVLAQ